MFITYIQLVNFKRMPLRDSNTFEHTFNPTNKLTMISGPNGSGKSSLFNELTPLPSDKNDFNPGGYKEIHIEKDHDKYILISDFTEKSAKFRFVMNGEELNTAAIVSTQRALVLKHFNISQNVHDILVGKENFTSMSLLARKKLFNTITHLNIDSVLEAYEKLREELKNNELLLKSQASILQREEAKLSDSTRLETLNATLQRTKDYSDLLLEMRTTLYKHKSDTSQLDLYHTHKDLTMKLKDLNQRYYLLRTSYPRSDIPKYTTKYNSELSVVDFQLNQLYTTLEEKDKERKALSLLASVDVDSLLKEEAQLTMEQSNLESSLTLLKDKSKVNLYSNEIYQLETSLPEILSEMQPNPTEDNILKYSRDTAYAADNNLRQQNELLNKAIQEEIRLVKAIEDYTSSNDTTTCPSCSYTWSPKDIPTLLKESREKLQTVLQDKHKAQTNIKQIEAIQEEQQTYFNQHRQFSRLVSVTRESLQEVWNRVHSLNYVYEDPPKIMTVIAQAALDVKYLRRLTEIDTRLSEIHEGLETLNTLRNTSLSNIEEEVNTLSNLAFELQAKKKDLLASLTHIQRANTLHTHLDKLHSEIKQSRTDVTTSNLSNAVDAIIATIDTDLTKSKVIIVETENELAHHKTISYSVEQAKKLIEDYQENSKILNITLDELSPKNGIIAKSVSSFINNIINNINNTIRGIWDYKMILRPLDIETEALNYKFKVEVEDKMTIDDINLVSNGMKEIINLSFKLVMYRLLGLEGSCLFLDEFGLTLDTNHRAKLFNLIFSLMSGSFYSQIFLITHVDQTLATYRDVEVIEL